MFKRPTFTRFVLRCHAPRLGAILLAAVIGWTLVIAPARAQGQDVRFVRDTEIENTIRVYVRPIFEVAGLDPSFVRVHLIESAVLNAFVSGGQRIFVHTGLLRAADHPGQVIGVFAHEVGHITGGHLIALRENLERAQATQIAAMLLGIPLALATGQGDLAAAATTAGATLATQNFLAYNRAMEQAADQAAVTYLDEARISSRGFAEFFDKLQRQSRLYTTETNAYTQTHPLTSERIAFARNHAANSPYADRPFDPELIAMHARLHAKIDGYLMTPDSVLGHYGAEDGSIPARYARAIALMRLHRVDEALGLIDGLIEEAPDDPFFHETKGEILRDAGRLAEAVPAYRRAVEILPWAALMRARLGQTMLELNDPRLDDEMLEHLREAVRYEPWLGSAWRTLAGAHARMGDIGNAALAQAEAAALRGDMDMARREAERAMEILPNGSPGWLRAEDISLQLNPPSQAE